MALKTEEDFTIREKYSDHVRIIIPRPFCSFTSFAPGNAPGEVTQPSFLVLQTGKLSRGNWWTAFSTDSRPTCAYASCRVVQEAKKEIRSLGSVISAWGLFPAPPAQLPESRAQRPRKLGSALGPSGEILSFLLVIPTGISVKSEFQINMYFLWVQVFFSLW